MNHKKRIKELLHIKSKKKFKILFSRSEVSQKRGRINPLEEAEISHFSADMALETLREILQKQGTADYTVISIETLE